MDHLTRGFNDKLWRIFPMYPHYNNRHVSRQNGYYISSRDGYYPLALFIELYDYLDNNITRSALLLNDKVPIEITRVISDEGTKIASQKNTHFSLLSYKRVKYRGSFGSLSLKNGILYYQRVPLGMLCVKEENVAYVKTEIVTTKRFEQTKIDPRLYTFICIEPADETIGHILRKNNVPSNDIPYIKKVLKNFLKTFSNVYVSSIVDTNLVEKMSTQIEVEYTSMDSYDKYNLEVKKNFISLYKELLKSTSSMVVGDFGEFGKVEHTRFPNDDPKSIVTSNPLGIWEVEKFYSKVESRIIYPVAVRRV
jgi:hypothetical protein